jgi:hypothetical protein
MLVSHAGSSPAGSTEAEEIAVPSLKNKRDANLNTLRLSVQPVLWFKPTPIHLWADRVEVHGNDGMIGSVGCNLFINAGHKEKPMSLYRHVLRSGTLIREKRKLLRWWVWSFNCNEEDYINLMKNRLVQLREEQARLMKQIPEHEGRVKDRKEAIDAAGGVSAPWRDRWTPRREPKMLKQDVKLKGKGKSDPKPPKRKPLLELHQSE